MKRRRIAIDCDDVIVPTAELIIRYYNKMYGSALTLADYYGKDPISWNAPDDQTAIARVHKYLQTAEYQTAKPFQEAVEAIHTLSSYHDLHVVTGRSDFLAQATNDMLTQYFPGVFQSIEFTNFYGNMQRSKSQVCQELGADLLIDDHLHHAEVVAQCGIDVLLFGQYPWNKGTVLLPNIRRVKSWCDVLEGLV